MLLSHHQLFSAFGGQGEKLQNRLETVLETGRIDAWLWGHEHRCVVYEPHGDVATPASSATAASRCTPSAGSSLPRAGGSRRPSSPASRRGRYMGYAVLDFEGPKIHVSYRDEFGGENYTETIE